MCCHSYVGATSYRNYVFHLLNPTKRQTKFRVAYHPSLFFMDPSVFMDSGVASQCLSKGCDIHFFILMRNQKFSSCCYSISTGISTFYQFHRSCMITSWFWVRSSLCVLIFNWISLSSPCRLSMSTRANVTELLFHHLFPCLGCMKDSEAAPSNSGGKTK